MRPDTGRVAVIRAVVAETGRARDPATARKNIFGQGIGTSARALCPPRDCQSSV